MTNNGVFKFFPVGQGLFYYGNINDGEITFVYDCGSTSDRDKCSEYIKVIKEELKDQRLCFVILSHFHADHCNMLQELYDVVGFDQLFIPFQNYNLAIGAFSSSVDSAKDYENIVFIKKILSKDLCDCEIFDVGNNNDNYKYLLKKFLNKWRFELISKQHDSYSVLAFQKAISKIDKTKLDYKKIGDIYSKIFKEQDINECSLMLFHYPPHIGRIKTNIIKKGHNPQGFTLLTGDINFNKDLALIVKEKYKKEGTNILKGLIQLPHHGSIKNFNSFRNSFSKDISSSHLKNPRYSHFSYYIVNYGINKYRHPCGDIFSDATIKNKTYRVCIEKKGSTIKRIQGFQYKVE